MTFTRHGHHITGTIRGPEPKVVEPCGGFYGCGLCIRDLIGATPEMDLQQAGRDAFDVLMDHGPDIMEPETLRGDNTANYPSQAMQMVIKYLDSMTVEPLAYEAYVVWFAKVLTGWKALVGTTRPDGRYYEVTHDGNLGQTYLDVYGKLANVVIPY